MIILLVIAVLAALGTVIAYLKKAGPFAIYHPESTNPTMQPETIPEAPKTTVATTSEADKLYAAAKAALGQKKTLNAAVPPELGCAEAVSTIMKEAGVTGLPVQGFAGTDALYAWLRTNPMFIEVGEPEAGGIVVSPTIANTHGHTGFFGSFGAQYSGDWGIVSNDSNTGLVREYWCWKEWQEYYVTKLNLDVHIYRWKGTIQG